VCLFVLAIILQTRLFTFSLHLLILAFLFPACFLLLRPSIGGLNSGCQAGETTLDA
jgi:hypothetical protein